MTITLQDIQFRRNTASYYTSNNPLLALGEPAFETDTNKLKIGNGVDTWNSLSYITGSGGTGAVDSVNGETGVIILTTDDLDDSTSLNKFITQVQLNKLDAIQGINTGDQDISGIATNASDIDTLEVGLAATVAATVLNTAKNSYPSADAAKVANLPSNQNSINIDIESRVSANDNKTGITSLQAGAIITNTAKVSYPGDQDASEVNLSTNINGQSTVQASLEDHESRIDTLVGGGSGDMLSANNLSDLADAPTALTNLGLTATSTELNYTDGVTSNIQTQLDSIQSSTTGINAQKIFALPIGTNLNPSADLVNGTNDGAVRCWYEPSNGVYTVTIPTGFSSSNSIYFAVKEGTTGAITVQSAGSQFTTFTVQAGDFVRLWKGNSGFCLRTPIKSDFASSGGITTDNQNKINNAILSPKTLAKSGSFTLASSDSYNNTSSDSDIGRSYIMEGSAEATVGDIGVIDQVWRFRIDSASDVFDIIPLDDNIVLDWEGKASGNAARLTGLKGGLIYMRKKATNSFFLDGDITGFTYTAPQVNYYQENSAANQGTGVGSWIGKEGSGATGTVANVSDADFDGGVALEINNNGGQFAGAGLDILPSDVTAWSNGVITQLDPNDVYEVSFDYKTENGGGNGVQAGYYSVRQNDANSPQGPIPNSNTVSSISYQFTVPSGGLSTGLNTLGINSNYAGDFSGWLRIANFSITKVENN